MKGRRRSTQAQRQTSHLGHARPDVSEIPLERRTYLSVAEAAIYLGFSLKAFRRLLERQPRLRALAFTIGRTLRFKRTDLDEALEDTRYAPPQGLRGVGGRAKGRQHRTIAQSHDSSLRRVT